jgi:hypothetical protein
MQNSSREIQKALMLGATGILLCLILGLILPITTWDWWMPPLLTVLIATSIGCFVSVGIIALRGVPVFLERRPRMANMCRRLFYLIAGIILSILSLQLRNPIQAPTPLLDDLATKLIFGFPGILLLAFGLSLNIWLEKNFGLNRWAVYRHSIRLVCLAWSFGMFLYGLSLITITNDGSYLLPRTSLSSFRNFMINTIALGASSWIAPTYLRDRKGRDHASEEGL